MTARERPARLRFEHVRGRTEVTRAFAESPVRILTPRVSGTSAWAFLSTLGGGLLDGDALSLEVELAPNARAIVTTQASTKVYRNRTRARARTVARVSNNAQLAWLPDPLVCFEQASFDQSLSIALEPNASVVACESVHAGRIARGESWSLRALRTSLTVTRDGAPELHDATVLDPSHGALTDRMHGHLAFATWVATGPAFAHLPREAAFEHSGPVRWSRAPIGRDGRVVRVVSSDTAALQRVLASLNEPARAVFGHVPADHRW
jgi:urease accessory protein